MSKKPGPLQELAVGALTSIRGGTIYAAAALVRQLVEVEYLLCLFANDPKEPERWASLSAEDLRKDFMPAAMRKRAPVDFRLGEYATHCELGGHPRYSAWWFATDHTANPTAPSPELRTSFFMVDLGQHLRAIWRWVEPTLLLHNLSHVGIARSSLMAAQAAISEWESTDPCAFKIPEKELGELRGEPRPEA